MRSVAELERADEGGARLEGAREGAGRVRAGPRAVSDGRRDRHAHGGRSAARGEEGLGAGERAGADAAAGRAARPQGPDGRARDAACSTGKTPLRVGDIILAIDGEPVRATAANDDELFARRSGGTVGSSVTLTMNRDGKERPLPVTLGQTPSQPREMKSYDGSRSSNSARATWPRSIARIRALKDRRERRAGRVGGGARLGLARAAERRRRRSWRSTASRCRTWTTSRRRMKDIAARKPASVVFEIRRGIRTMFIEIQPAWK